MDISKDPSQYKERVVPSKEELFKKHFNLEYQDIEGIWSVIDTFSHYEYDLAIDIGIKRFLQTHTPLRLVDQDKRIVVLFDERLQEEDEVINSIKSDLRWSPGKKRVRKKLINVLIILIILLILILIYALI